MVETGIGTCKAILLFRDLMVGENFLIKPKICKMYYVIYIGVCCNLQTKTHLIHEKTFYTTSLIYE